MRHISIYRDGIWAGNGLIGHDGQIIDCPAILGTDQNESDLTYEEIESTIAESPADTGSVVRPDGVYSWIISED